MFCFEFTHKKKKYIINSIYVDECFLGDRDDIVLSERDICLLDYLPYLHKLTYEYDFGDSWIHEIEIESIEYQSSRSFGAICLDGKGKRPPEDVGGKSGYDEFYDAYHNPDHEEHKSYVMWADGRYPDYDIDEINKKLNEVFLKIIVNKNYPSSVMVR